MFASGDSGPRANDERRQLYRSEIALSCSTLELVEIKAIWVLLAQDFHVGPGRAYDVPRRSESAARAILALFEFREKRK